MKKKFWNLSFILISIMIVLFMGLKFDGSLERLFVRRQDFIRNIHMGGHRYSFRLSSLSYYLRNITEPFALLNIGGNIGPFAVLSFFTCGVLSKKRCFYSFLYCIFWGIGIEIFQYVTWFGAFDVSDILLRLIGTLMGLFVYAIILGK